MHLPNLDPHLNHIIQTRAEQPPVNPVSDSLVAEISKNQRRLLRRKKLGALPVIGKIVRSAYQLADQKMIPIQIIKSVLKNTPYIWPAARWAFAILRIVRIRDQIQHQILVQQTELATLRSKLEQSKAELEHYKKAVFVEQQTLAERTRKTEETLSQYAAISSVQTASQNSQPALQNVMLDQYYLDFENTFRGTREDIQSRLQAYLPFISSDMETGRKSALDIGCGRGEWLEILSARGFACLGIDINDRMVNVTQSHGITALKADAIEWLATCEADSQTIITAFHVIEHLPFEQLLHLFRLAYRALEPGGIIIFETPNPENLQVGAYTFYNDPTHRNPIPPAIAAFMATQSGFGKTHIERLHPYPADRLANDNSEAAHVLRQLCFGPQDYAVIAWKTH